MQQQKSIDLQISTNRIVAEDGVITSTILNTVLQYQLQYLIKQLAIIFESKYILSLLLNFNNFNLH